jgi:hypothetical protein
MPITIGNGITLGSGVTITPFFPGKVSNTEGSVQFAGTNYLSVKAHQQGQITAMGTNDFTWECYVHPIITAGYQTVIDTRTQTIGGDTTGFYFGTNFNTLTLMYYTDNVQLESSIDMNLNTWNHIALTRDSGTLTIWVNGVSGGTYADSTNLTQQRVFIGGSSNNGLNMTGYISNLRMVNGVAVYTDTFTPLTTRLSASQNAGTNISAISSGQTALLLDTSYGSGYLIDSSNYNLTVDNNGDAINSTLNPF